MEIELIAEIIVLLEPKKIEVADNRTDEEIHLLRKEYAETLKKEGRIVKEIYATYKGTFYSD